MVDEFDDGTFNEVDPLLVKISTIPSLFLWPQIFFVWIYFGIKVAAIYSDEWGQFLTNQMCK